MQTLDVVFPQLKALGRSETAVLYGIVDANEAKSYFEHPILKVRWTACCKAILLHKDRSALGILVDVDAIKLKSSMTLFALVCGEEDSIFFKYWHNFSAEEWISVRRNFLPRKRTNKTEKI